MITDIHLLNFRSYKDASFDLAPGVNILVGPNASGKTNLLEAILVIANGKSYRAGDKELITFGKDIARLEVHTPNGTRIIKIEKNSPLTKTFEINSQKLKRLVRAKTVPVVLFEPNHLLALIGSPEARRNFIDDLLEQTITGYGGLRSQYRRALSQRNSLLKNSKTLLPNQVFPWDVRLSTLGGQIVKLRLSVIAAINKEIDQIYKHISNTKLPTRLNYKTTCDSSQYETSLLNKLQLKLNLDHQRGFTSDGPHRDDIDILLNHKLINQVASRGEIRSLLLALKVIEAHLIELARNTAPLLLLDDVFSELDGSRRYALTDFLKNYQTFITTTDADVVVQHFTQTANIIPLASS